MKLLAVTALALVALSAAGCKSKQRYAPSCQRAVAMTAPWDGYALPTGGGRVCSSDPARLQVQYLSGDRASWETSYAAALTAGGFTKDRCTGESCTFKRGDEKATVHVMQAPRWVTVVVRR
jgi:hypothetical protein